MPNSSARVTTRYVLVFCDFPPSPRELVGGHPTVVFPTKDVVEQPLRARVQHPHNWPGRVSFQDLVLTIARSQKWL